VESAGGIWIFGGWIEAHQTTLSTRSGPRAGLKYAMNRVLSFGLNRIDVRVMCALVLWAMIAAPLVFAADKKTPSPDKAPAADGKTSTPGKTITTADGKVTVSGKTGTAAATATTPLARAVAAKGSDFDRMAIVLGLDGNALVRYHASLAERDAAYAKWLKSAEGQKYDAAQKELNRAKRGRNQQGLPDAQKKYEPLRSEQEKVRADLRREFNKQFKPEQLRLWAGHMLYTTVISKFEIAKLDDAQKQQALAICCVLVGSLDDAAIAKDPYLNPDAKSQERAKAEIERLVLGADQRGKMTK